MNRIDLVRYSVLVALTRFIPVPLADDAVRLALLRSQVRELAAAHGRELSEHEQRVLTDDGSSGCGCGCLFNLLFFPVRKILPKVLVVLEMKKLSDLATLTFVQGYLMDEIMRQGLWPEGGASRVRQAVDNICRDSGTSPVEHVFRLAFESAQRGLRKAGDNIARRLNQQTDPEQAVEVEKEEARGLQDLIENLAASLNAIPASYFEGLQKQLRQELGPPGPRPGHGLDPARPPGSDPGPGSV